MKKTKIEFTIEPVKQDSTSPSSHGTPTESEVSQLIDLSFKSTQEIFSPQSNQGEINEIFDDYTLNDIDITSGVAEELLFQDNVDQSIEPSPHMETEQTITGNVLDASEGEGDLLSLENIAIDELANDEGIVELSKEDGIGTLTLYTQDVGDHKQGDFSYTISQSDDLPASHESFSYTIHHPQGDASLTLSFELSESGPKIGQPENGFIDEMGLLPGRPETLETFGNLDIEDIDEPGTSVKFAPLIAQEALIEENITSEGKPLYYVLNEEGNTLNAYQGANGTQVFEVKLFDDGSFNFQLNSVLDREPQENLLHDANFEMLGKQNAYMFEFPFGWHDHQSTLTNIKDKQSLDNEVIVTQDIKTNIGETFHLSLYMGTPEGGQGKIELFWNDKLIKTFEANQSLSGYNFTVDSGYQNTSELKIVGHQLNQDLGNYLHGMSLSSMDMQKYPLEFKFNVLDGNEVVDHSFLRVNIATEPPIVLEHSEPFNIVYEQAMYQNIILNEQTFIEGQPLTTLNLDAMFDQLNIADDARQVDVVQLEDNGLKTNIYEVKISDKGSTSEPITVADIRLMFPGGEEGLNIFYKNIQVFDS